MEGKHLARHPSTPPSSPSPSFLNGSIRNLNYLRTRIFGFPAKSREWQKRTIGGINPPYYPKKQIACGVSPACHREERLRWRSLFYIYWIASGKKSEIATSYLLPQCHSFYPSFLNVPIRNLNYLRTRIFGIPDKRFREWRGRVNVSIRNLNKRERRCLYGSKKKKQKRGCLIKDFRHDRKVL